MSDEAPTVVKQKLEKKLGLFDVYVISTGAMFSSGFFLLPGIATAYAGPATVLAYVFAGILMIPAMLSMAELSAAMPKAGGTYYYIDRGLGPWAGTVGGLGTWLALVLKSGFALLGMGAYLAITPWVSNYLPTDEGQMLWLMKGIAVALTVVFMFVNIFGAKESTRLQAILVMALLGVLGFFTLQGLWYVFFEQDAGTTRQQYTPFLHEERGVEGMITTIGLVFVSYAGLTKVASVSEEVRNPDRNLPLGMFLSLATATAIYVLGVFIMIAVLEPEALRRDYTPVATAAEAFFDWLPQPMGLLLVIVAAFAAFASTGNAGILSASRYPLAMGRDRLISEKFDKLGKHGTPTLGIVVTSALMIFFIVALSAEGVAKLASAFNLMAFGLINLVVIVMRESRLASYDPGFRSPLYPWMQIAGIGISVWLVSQLGPLAITFCLGVLVACTFWYLWYARPRVVRHGAIYHWFERLGRQRHDELDIEFRDIIKDKGLRDADPFDTIVADAVVIDAPQSADYTDMLTLAAGKLAQVLPMQSAEIVERFVESGLHGGAPVSGGAMLPHFRLPEIEHSYLVMIRTRQGVAIDLPVAPPRGAHPNIQTAGPSRQAHVFAVFLLVSPENDPGLHLRILAQLAAKIEDENFLPGWLHAPDEVSLKEILLRDERFLALQLKQEGPTAELIGKPLSQAQFPQGLLVALIRRHRGVFVPSGSTVLQADDRLTLVGEPDAVRKAVRRFDTTTEKLPREKTSFRIPEAARKIAGQPGSGLANKVERLADSLNIPTAKPDAPAQTMDSINPDNVGKTEINDPDAAIEPDPDDKPNSN